MELSTIQANAYAADNGEPCRDNLGQVHCPCGTVTGLNLNKQIPPLTRCHECRNPGARARAQTERDSFRSKVFAANRR